MRDRQRHCRAAIRRKLTAAVKAEPTHPQHRGPDHHKARIMGGRGLIFPCAQENCDHQGRKACGFMHDNPAREIAHACLAKDATIRHHAAAPDPMHDRRINDQHPQRRKQKHKAKPNPFHIGAHNQGGRDNGKGHLKRKKQDFRQAARQAICGDPVEKCLVQPAPKS